LAANQDVPPELPFFEQEEQVEMYCRDGKNRVRRSRSAVSSRRDAFTLMEVLLVLVILVVLGSMAVGIFGGTQERAFKDAARGEVGIMKTQIELFKFHTKKYPSALLDLVQAPSDAKMAERWEGPYIDKSAAPVDPWDYEYKLAVPGKHNPDSFDVWSVGPDGQDGTDDDIGNWQSASS
jgi:general secretion pathway protein G